MNAQQITNTKNMTRNTAIGVQHVAPCCVANGAKTPATLQHLCNLVQRVAACKAAFCNCNTPSLYGGVAVAMLQGVVGCNTAKSFSNSWKAWRVVFAIFYRKPLHAKNCSYQ